MKKIFFTSFIFIPCVLFAQFWSDCGFGSGAVCPKPYELDFDKDTVYLFSLKKEYCMNYLSESPTDILINFSNERLVVSHEYSVNCCTFDTYRIEVKKDTIKVFSKSEGEICTCGSCGYQVRFEDLEPLKRTYRVIIDNVIDTIVSTNTSNHSLWSASNHIKYTREDDKMKIEIDDVFGMPEVWLYSVNGNMLSHKKYKFQEFYVDLPKEKGMYIIKVWNGKTFDAKKIAI